MSNRTPFFQFYPADFLVGSASMTCEGRGAYIALLCHAWESDGVPDDMKTLRLLTGASKRTISEILHKFSRGQDGRLRNLRMEETRKSLAAFQAKQSERGRKGWETRRKGKAASDDDDMTINARSYDDEMISNANQSQSQSIRPLTSVSDLVAPTAEIPNWEAVKVKAAMIGLPEWKAHDWFHRMEECGWTANNGKPIMNWESGLTRVRSWWQQDGCPKENENNKRNNSKRVDRNRGTLNERAVGEPNPFAGIENH